jgi:hypothetical protein
MSQCTTERMSQMAQRWRIGSSDNWRIDDYSTDILAWRAEFGIALKF